MKQRIHHHSAMVLSTDGTRYEVVTWGERRPDGLWSGWLEFVPRHGGGRQLRTDQETTQPNRDALAYWASGLEDVYIEGAFERAVERSGVPLAPRVD
jgi:hypothetical protein